MQSFGVVISELLSQGWKSFCGDFQFHTNERICVVGIFCWVFCYV